jgi:hypothetical protein
MALLLARALPACFSESAGNPADGGACMAGHDGCACSEGSCLGGLVCHAPESICVADDCVAGRTGCPCRDDGGCDADLVCDGICGGAGMADSGASTTVADPSSSGSASSATGATESVVEESGDSTTSARSTTESDASSSDTGKPSCVEVPDCIPCIECVVDSEGACGDAYHACQADDDCYMAYALFTSCLSPGQFCCSEGPPELDTVRMCFAEQCQNKCGTICGA